MPELTRKVTISGKRVKITYTNENGVVVAQDDVELETYKKNYPKETE